MLGALKLFLLSGAAGLMASAQPVVQDSAALTDQAQTIATNTDGSDRMTVGVHIDGQGPFPFVVDTGAERTVISSELARQLALEAIATATMHSLSEAGSVSMVNIPRLSVSNATIENIRAPALARENMGALGILGIDTLQDQRVILDFRKGRMIVMPSSAHDDEQRGDEIVVRARSRFGRLVLADATADGQKVYVIVDTGAQVTVGNPSLHARLLRGKKFTANPIELVSVTGGVVMAQHAVVHSIRIGGVEMREMPIAIADAHVFHQLNLDDRPAILLGMDVLRSFDRVSVDFANRRVRFMMPNGAAQQPQTQSADSEVAPKRS